MGKGGTLLIIALNQNREISKPSLSVLLEALNQAQGRASEVKQTGFISRDHAEGRGDRLHRASFVSVEGGQRRANVQIWSINIQGKYSQDVVPKPQPLMAK